MIIFNNNGDLKQRIKDGFSLDKRSLSFYRVVLSIFLLVDLILRSQNLKEHYTDAGVYPRSSSIQTERYSIHQLSGSTEFAVLLFIIHGLIYCSLLVGYKTRLSAILSFIFLCSIQNRNHFLIDGSDDYSRILLFFAIFLPLNKYYSIDSILKKSNNNNKNSNNNINTTNTNNNNNNNNKKKRYLFLSGSTISFILQFSFIYIFTALYKTGSTWHVDYSAVYYSLNLVQFRHGLATYLLQFPNFLIFLTRFTLFFEYIGPLLMVSPFFNTACRLISIFGFICMHIGFGACLNLYLFVFIPMVTCMVFLPSEVWEIIQSRYIEKKKQITIYYNVNSPKSLQLFIRLYSMFFLVLSNVTIKPIKNVHDRDTTVDNGNDGNENGNCSGQESSQISDNMSLVYVDNITVLSNHQVYDEEHSIQFLFSQSLPFNIISKIMNDKIFKLLFNYIKNFGSENEKDHYQMEKLKAKSQQQQQQKQSKSTTTSTIKQSLRNLFFILIITYMFYYNVCVYSVMHDDDVYTVTPKLQPLARVIKIDQYWAMFAPSPPDVSVWIVSDGKFKYKKNIDILADKETDFKVIPDYFFHMGQRKRNFYLSISYLETLRLEFGRYQCRYWNIDNPTLVYGRLDSFKLYAVFRDTPLPPTDGKVHEETPNRLQLIWEHVC